jgi:membrane protein DedA with SNARE-associated domain
VIRERVIFVIQGSARRRRRDVLPVASTAVTGIGGAVALALLLPMEAGVPIPPPADLVMFAVGERVAAGAFPLWLAVLGLEAVALLGTAALFFACRGPAHAVIIRAGSRVGLGPERLGRAAAVLEHRGGPALTIGRATPGLRTVTVVAAGGAGIAPRRALSALVLGSSAFLQLHFVLGLLLGPVADSAFNHAKGPALVGLVVLVGLAFAFWLSRRRHAAADGDARVGAAQACAEASCPACLLVSALAERAPGHFALAAPHGDA